MSKKDKIRTLLVVGLAICIGLVYSLPQWIALANGDGGVFVNWDESWYMTRVFRALQGDFWVGSPFIFEDKGDLPIVPALAESIIGGLGFIWNKLFFWIVEIDNGLILALTRFFGPFLITIALFLGFSLCGLTFGLSVFLSGLILTEPALYYLKPFWATSKVIESLPFNRSINPIVNIGFFFLAWASAVWAFNDRGKRVLPAVVAGLLLGTLFYSSLYYWSHLILALIGFVLLGDQKNKWKTFGIGAGTALLAGIPYVILQLKVQSYEAFPDFSWRHGMFYPADLSWVLGHKSLWGMLALTLGLFFLREKKLRFLSITALSGTFLYLSPLFTGIDFQAWHYKHTAFPLLWASAIGLVCYFFEKKLGKRIKTPFYFLIPVYLVLMIVVATKANFKQYEVERMKKNFPQQGVGLLTSDQKSLLKKIKDELPDDSVIMAHVDLMPVIPMHTRKWVWLDNHMTSDLMPMDEIFKRYMVYWKIMGLAAADVEKMMFNPSEDNLVPIWFYGLPISLRNELVEREKPSLSLELQKELAPRLAKLYEETEDEYFKKVIEKYKLNYLVLKTDQKIESISQFLKLELVTKNGNLNLYKVLK